MRSSRLGNMRSTQMARPLALLMAALALPACASLPEEGFAPYASAPAPLFDPITFFEGRSEGTGILDKGPLGTVPVRVESVGTVSRAGVLTLTQEIAEGDKPPRTRTWTIERLADGRYDARLTDAFGPVEIWGTGNTMNVRYTAEGSMVVTQRITLAPDGASATNILRVHLLGVEVAVLTEEIVRLP